MEEVYSATCLSIKNDFIILNCAVLVRVIIIISRS